MLLDYLTEKGLTGFRESSRTEEGRVMLEAIIFSAFLELGYLNNATCMLYQSEYFETEVYTEISLYADFEFRASWYGIYLGGGIKTYFIFDKDISYIFPHRVDPRIFVGWKHGFFEIGAQHECTRPVIPVSYHLKPTEVQDRSSNKIFVKFSIGGKK